MEARESNTATCTAAEHGSGHVSWAGRQPRVWVLPDLPTESEVGAGAALDAIGVIVSPMLAVVGRVVGAQACLGCAFRRSLQGSPFSSDVLNWAAASRRSAVSLDRPTPLGRTAHRIAEYAARGELDLSVNHVVIDSTNGACTLLRAEPVGDCRLCGEDTPC